MKLGRGVILIAVVGACLPAYAGPDVKDVWETGRVRGTLRGIDYWEPVYGTYDYSGALPLFGEVTHTIEGETFHIESRVSKFIRDGTVVYRAEQHSYCPWCSGGAQGGASASLSVHFMVDSPTLTISARRDINSEGYGFADAMLNDLTSGASWEILGGNWWSGPRVRRDSVFLHLDPGHEYELVARAYAPEYHSSSIEVAFGNVFIPAPGAILLGTLGTGLVGWLRRRRAV